MRYMLKVSEQAVQSRVRTRKISSPFPELKIRFSIASRRPRGYERLPV
jgi:hypothetical protein